MFCLHSLLSPVNFLDHTQHKGLAVAVYGVLFCKLVGMVLSHHPLPFTKDVVNKGTRTYYLEIYYLVYFIIWSSG